MYTTDGGQLAKAEFSDLLHLESPISEPGVLIPARVGADTSRFVLHPAVYIYFLAHQIVRTIASSSLWVPQIHRFYVGALCGQDLFSRYSFVHCAQLFIPGVLLSGLTAASFYYIRSDVCTILLMESSV